MPDWLIGWWAFLWALADALGETASRSLNSDAVARLVVFSLYLIMLFFGIFLVAKSVL